MERRSVVTGVRGGIDLACPRRLARRRPVLLAELDEGKLGTREIAERTSLARMHTADEIAAVAGGATHGFESAVESGRATESPRGR